MDGPLRLGQRTLVIEFQIDRHAQNRVELAYRRVEMPETAKPSSETSVQIADSFPFTETAFALEIHG